MKPYDRIQKIKIAGSEFDRRKKITYEQKAEIIKKWQNGQSKHSLSREYNISRKMITILTDPKRAEHFRQYANQYCKEHRAIKEERAKIQAEHRRYKKKLFIDGKINL